MREAQTGAHVLSSIWKQGLSLPLVVERHVGGRETTEWSAVTVHTDLPPPHSLQELYIYNVYLWKREGEKTRGWREVGFQGISQ